MTLVNPRWGQYAEAIFVAYFSYIPSKDTHINLFAYSSNTLRSQKLCTGRKCRMYQVVYKDSMLHFQRKNQGT